MKNGKLLDLYSGYLISAFGQTTAAGLSSLLDGEVSHDQLQRLLASEEQTSADLWRIVKPHVREISNSKSKIRYGGTEASSSPSSMKRNRSSQESKTR